MLPIAHYDDVVDRADDAPFGLAGSVRGPDRAAAIDVANRLETGTVWVDEIHIHGVMIPFGGHKQSGMSVENGVEGLTAFADTRTMMFRT